MICDHYKTLREHFNLVAAAVVREFEADESVCVRRYNSYHPDGHIPVPVVEVSTHRPPIKPGEPPQHRVVGRVELEYTNGGSIQRVEVTIDGRLIHSVAGYESSTYLRLSFSPDDVRALFRAAVKDTKP